MRLLFEFLIRCYPRDFRGRYELEIRALHESRMEHLGHAEQLLTTLSDHLPEIPRAWKESLSLRMHSRSSTPTRKASLVRHMEQILADLKYGLRSLRRTPGFLAVAVVTMALGTGANTAIFSVINAVVLRPLPFPDPDLLIRIARATPTGSLSGYVNSRPDIDDLPGVEGIDAVAGYSTTSFTIVRDGVPDVLRGVRVTSGLLDLFGMNPVLGRDIRNDETMSGDPLVAVISSNLWQNEYRADSAVIGRTIVLSDRTYEIVGIAPPGFAFPNDPEVWTNAQSDLAGCGRSCHNYSTIARMTPTASTASVDAGLSTLASRLADEFPESNLNKRFKAISLEEDLIGDSATALMVLFSAVGLMLLIACANVANLTIARNSTRGTEMATRAALGARRGRLVTQMLVESSLLAMAGGLLGILVAKLGTSVLVSLAPPGLPRIDEVSIDAVVLGYALLVTGVVSVLFGLGPALRASSVSMASRLAGHGKGDGGSVGRSRSRSALLASEVAVSVVLLTGAVLMVKTVSSLRTADLGFNEEGVVTFSVVLPSTRYDADEMVRFWGTLESQLALLPEVQSVGGALGRVLSGNDIGSAFTLGDRPEPAPGEAPSAMVRTVTPGYLETLGTNLLQGRGLTEQDTHESQPVILVSRAFAERYFGSVSGAIGNTAQLGIWFGYRLDEPATIVGVVGDMRSRHPRLDVIPEIYLPVAQSAPRSLQFVVRTASADASIAQLVKAVVGNLDGGLPVRDVSDLASVANAQFGAERFYMLLLTIFALTAVVLSAVGLYGVVSFAVSQRTREFGIRVALGADVGSLFKMVILQGLRPTLAGVFVGVIGSLLAVRAISSLLYGVTPTDPLVLVAVSLVLIAVMIAATIVPAGRATKVAPVEALRTE